MKLWTLDKPGYLPLCSDCALPLVQEAVNPFVGLMPEFPRQPETTEEGVEWCEGLFASMNKPRLFVELEHGECHNCGRRFEDVA